MMKIKQLLHDYCLNNINHRLHICENALKNIQESLQSETKSSAGDKHETGRAMIQLERENLGNQLKQLELEKAILLKINPHLIHNQVQLGSVIFTSQNNYFIATSIGEAKIEDDSFYIISKNAPMGKLLLGKNVSDKITFRDNQFEILKIF